jgi:hypothetical protein
MDNVQNCDRYIGTPWSEPYTSRFKSTFHCTVDLIENSCIKAGIAICQMLVREEARSTRAYLYIPYTGLSAVLVWEWAQVEFNEH